MRSSGVDATMLKLVFSKEGLIVGLVIGFSAQDDDEDDEYRNGNDVQRQWEGLLSALLR